MSGARGAVGRVYLYEDPSSPTLDVREVAGHVAKVSGIPTSTRKEFLSHHGLDDAEAVARQFAAVRVTNIARPLQPVEPPSPLVLFERRRLESPGRRVHGVLYDGFRVQGILREILPPEERGLDVAHIAFTSRLVGTFDDADRRYHARAIVIGHPSLISTTGLVEGPAKPRDFYAAKRGLRITAADARYESLKERFSGRFLDFDDPRLTQVAKGYALQALFYRLTAEPFCDQEDCVLFNAHWQEEMLHAQVESGLLCARHRAIAQALRDGRRTRKR